MKYIKITLSVILLLIFISCSSDGNDLKEMENAKLSFGLFLNNLTENKIPSNQDFHPSYAEIIISQDGKPVMGSIDNPFRISLASQTFNQKRKIPGPSPSELDLVPGAYTLDYFQVFSEEGNLIMIAPVNEGTAGLASLVEKPLPLGINLGSGVRKQVEVDVVLFDERLVNQYGYSFFNFQGSEVLEFCIFGSFCLENGRHADAARYTVSVWEFSGDSENPKGNNLYNNLENKINSTDTTEVSSEPLCLALPDKAGTNAYYFEIRILNFDYQTEEKIIRSGVITDEDIRSLFDGNENLNYYHFREGNCAMEDSPELFQESDPGVDPDLDTDGDGVPDVNDNCPYQYNNQSQGSVDYFGESCFDPCIIKTDEEDHLAIALKSEEEFTEISNGPGHFYASLVFLHKELVIGYLSGRMTENNLLEVDVYIDAGRYLEDHVIELKDDMLSESICKKIYPTQIVSGPNPGGSYSRFTVELPEDFSTPYYIKFKGNLFVNF